MTAVLPALARAGAGALSAISVENAMDIVKTGLVKSVQFVLPPILLPAVVKEIYRYAVIAPNIDNENLIDPNYSINVFKAFAAAVGILSAADANEVAEILTEGIGEAISDALRHVITEPFEKVFSLYRGNREIDEDEIADAYSYGTISPSVLGVMAGMNGYSSVSTLMLLSKSAGMLYSQQVRGADRVADALAARAFDARIDPFDLALSMARSVVNGIDEAVRGEADRIYGELRQIAGRAFDRLRDAYHALYLATRLYQAGDRTNADAFAEQARAMAEDADAYLDVFDIMEEHFADPVLADLLDRSGDIISMSVQHYLDVIAAFVNIIGTILEPLLKYLADAVAAMYEEVNQAAAALAQYRSYVPLLPAPELVYEPGTGGASGNVVVGVRVL